MDITLFDFDYPIFDEMYRPVLEKKIINRYYFREIGLETVAQFKHFLRTRLNEIMPFYNRQYLALQVYETYDPYVNKDMTVTENRTVTSDSSRESRLECDGRVTYNWKLIPQRAKRFFMIHLRGQY